MYLDFESEKNTILHVGVPYGCTIKNYFKLFLECSYFAHLDSLFDEFL